MKLLFPLLFILSSFWGSTQLKQKTADNYYKNLEYSKCVEMYEELAEKAITGHKKGDWENVHKAAECNFHLFKMEKACFYYENMYANHKLDEHDCMHYLDALRYTEEYSKSIIIATESAELYSDNIFFPRLINKSNNFNSLFADSAFYSIRATTINSGMGDFSPAYFNNSIVYTSKSSNTGFLTPKYGWDNAYFLNIMQADFNPDSTLNDAEMLKNNFISKAHDGPVSFNLDGTEMVITKNTIGKKNDSQIIVLSLYFSKFLNGEWTELVPFEFNNPEYSVGHGVLSEDGSKLYFVSDQPESFGETDIYVSSKIGGSWGKPINLGNKINTERSEMFPFVQNETIYFASNGHYGLGGLDIFEAPINGTVYPKNIGYPVNTSKDDFGLIFDLTGEIGFLSSNRGNNIDRIYHVEKRKPNLDLIVSVFEKYENLEKLAGQEVWIENITTSSLDSLITDSLGQVKTTLNWNQEYRIFTHKKEYKLLKDAQLNTLNIKKDSSFIRKLVLIPTTIQIHIRVVEKGTGKVIPTADITITDYALKTDSSFITNDEGIITINVDRNKSLWAHGSKKGYIDGDIAFNTANQNDRVIDIELELPPIKVGEKFKLENIFYDLNKSTLREESKSSLDKLADFIIKNNLTIELSAHTDSRGSNYYNQKLSQARAQSCVDYLKKKGVPSKNIKAKGYGESKLVNKCKNGVKCTEEEHQENRRTEVKILKLNK